jgi:serine phosphatase RsbU (regulator of sigma subunit)
MTEIQDILLEHQQHYLSQWLQFVLLDQEGKILDSNHSFADLRHLYGQSIYQFNPFLESIQSVIEALDEHQSELFFPRMEIPFWGKDGVFDYTIKRIQRNNQIFYLWIIEDNTAHNQYLSLVQQERNDTYIQNELLQLKTQNQILKEEVEKQTADIQAQKQLIEKQKEDILDSIRYAQRIQNAILPTQKTLTQVNFETMIFYRPKDIVSGDFYWATQVGNKAIVVVSDCTGHGVPGAFMSIVGQNMLQTAINSQKITSPKQMLESLDKQMLQLFENDNRVHDGMDIAILAIDNQENSITFAGAKRPLYFIREGSFQEIKGAPYAIGGHHVVYGKNFVEFTLQIQPNDIFYLCSDGYADQFGGTEDKKFMLKNFKNLLLKIHHLPFALQQDILLDNLLSWQGENKQTDDILIVGLRF